MCLGSRTTWVGQVGVVGVFYNGSLKVHFILLLIGALGREDQHGLAIRRQVSVIAITKPVEPGAVGCLASRRWPNPGLGHYGSNSDQPGLGRCTAESSGAEYGCLATGWGMGAVLRRVVDPGMLRASIRWEGTTVAVPT